MACLLVVPSCAGCHAGPWATGASIDVQHLWLMQTPAPHVHAGAGKAMCAAALFAIDKARMRMWVAFAAARRHTALPQGQTTLDGWVVTPSRATPLKDCADAAAACAVAGLYAELQVFLCAFGDSPPAQLQGGPADHLSRCCCACTVRGFIWWALGRVVSLDEGLLQLSLLPHAYCWAAPLLHRVPGWVAARRPFASLFPTLKRRLHNRATLAKLQQGTPAAVPAIRHSCSRCDRTGLCLSSAFRIAFPALLATQNSTLLKRVQEGESPQLAHRCATHAGM